MMQSSDILKPGMVGINLKGRLDLVGTLDECLQGDTQAAHVWWVLPNGRIATTGANLGVFYGEVDPTRYLKGKRFYLLETVDPLTSHQLEIMQSCHDALMKSGMGRLYGIWKFEWLFWLEALDGKVSKTGLKPAIQKRPTCPVCSQAVAYALWNAGVPVGKGFGKEDWSAVLPKDFLAEAQMTTAELDAGLLKGLQDTSYHTPCYQLKLVQKKAYHTIF